MPARRQCEFFLLRYVPDAVKDEFVNFGVLLVESNGEAGQAGMEARFTRDWSRVRCLDPNADLEMLESLASELERGLRQPGDGSEILSQLQQSLSGNVQLSPAKACLTESPREEIEKLARLYLESRRGGARVRSTRGRQVIFQRMRDAFQREGVWSAMHRQIPVAKYTRPGDPLKIDCGYQPDGVLKLFHALSLTADVDSAKVLAFSFPQIAAGIRRVENADARLTAVVEDGLSPSDQAIAFAFEVLAGQKIAVAPVVEMPRLAETVRQELGL